MWVKIEDMYDDCICRAKRTYQTFSIIIIIILPVLPRSCTKQTFLPYPFGQQPYLDSPGFLCPHLPALGTFLGDFSVALTLHRA